MAKPMEQMVFVWGTQNGIKSIGFAGFSGPGR
jgi:hypothetical protein